MEFLFQGGPVMWIILIFLVVDLVMLVTAIAKLFGSGEKNYTVIANNLNTAQWMGAISAVTGLLGTLMGISQAAKAISEASAISHAIIWGGMHIALMPFIFGVYIFILTSLVVLFIKRKIK